MALCIVFKLKYIFARFRHARRWHLTVNNSLVDMWGNIIRNELGQRKRYWDPSFNHLSIRLLLLIIWRFIYLRKKEKKKTRKENEKKNNIFIKLARGIKISFIFFFYYYFFLQKINERENDYLKKKIIENIYLVLIIYVGLRWDFLGFCDHRDTFNCSFVGICFSQTILCRISGPLICLE